MAVVSAETGEPISGVEFSYRGWEGDQFGRKQFVSNRSGRCDIAVPRSSITVLELTSMIDGYADTRLEWRTDRGETIPETYTLRLTRPAHIGGHLIAPFVGLRPFSTKWPTKCEAKSSSRPLACIPMSVVLI